MAYQQIDGPGAVLSETLLAKLVDLALRGDSKCLIEAIERLFPTPRGRLVKLAISPVTDIKSAVRGLSEIANAAARGEISGAESADLCKPFETYITTLENTRLPEQIADRTFTISIGNSRISQPRASDAAAPHSNAREPVAEPVNVTRATEPAETHIDAASHDTVPTVKMDTANVIRPSLNTAMENVLRWSCQPSIPQLERY